MAKTQGNNPSNTVKQAFIRLAEADMVFWLMPLLIILLVSGTIAQRWIGLYQAHALFFSSFIIWLGPIPLPGGYTILGVLTLNLSIKFLLKSEWSWRKSGIILSHLGALVLLIGGLITSIVAQERYMVILEGSETPFTYHYTKKNLMIFENDNGNEKEITRMPFDHIQAWNTNNLPFTITIKHSCENCQIQKRQESDDYNEETSYFGMAQFMALQNKPLEKDPEANLTGFEFIINGSDNDGEYLAFDGMPKPIELSANRKNYTLIFGKAQTMLPFTVHLTDFVKDDYAGTAMARSYHSDVIIKDGDIEWPTRIEMNKPLRYKGYTLFQSSFDQSEDGEISVFSVVKNEGWLFPYIGTIILALGLILHILITFKQGRSA